MMANGDVGNTLHGCTNILSINTIHPEQFLSVQDAAAAEFTSLTKALYDLQKGQESADCRGSPLYQLVVENFDEEQIWQELELQNSAVLKHFETAVQQAVSDDTLSIVQEEEDDEVEEGMGDEEDAGSSKALLADNAENVTDDDSDVNFDVDTLEKKVQQKKLPAKKASKQLGVPSEVDDRFFKLSEMESFLDDMDKREGKEGVGEEDVDYFQDLPSGDEEEEDLNFENLPPKKHNKKSMVKSSRNLKYKDFFDTVDGAPAKTDDMSEDEDSMDGMQEGEEEEEEDDDDYDDEDNEDEDFIEDGEDEEGRQAKEALKKVSFDLPEDEEESEGEDMEDIFGGKAQKTENPEPKSTFEKRQEKMSDRIDELEKAALGDKPWQLTGEVSAQTRPENSMLEENVEFDQASRRAPAVTEETTLQLEDIIKQRIKDKVWDDVVRKEKPKEEVFEYKKRLTLDHEKSKLSLAQVYEQEYLKKTQTKTEEEESPAHVEIQKLMDTLFLKLDALSNFHFTPKPPVPEVKVVSNMPSITMEEVAPVSASDATLLAPEEVKEKNKAGDMLGDSEKTSTDKKRERRKKKVVKRLKIKDKERKQKLKEASQSGENRKISKAEVAENLKKLTKGGKATLLKDEGKDKALRSSQAFFSQLQDQVKSQIKGAKDQASKKKKHKELSASKLKL
ncbi:U3 small nucleolar ribonucleoprotein protein MPP10 [Hypomesus transpacificus]|uniref:U3 small nucleolar ribonucleoprotein protein MPP10 n=1 Tax=Hypomesus transpacificus TaxID=137520 RepID=UPI001F078086|nr:U3 small nucleolar ribonucleoprotein protein MPP10 [Hypomesus transpacificus]